MLAVVLLWGLLAQVSPVAAQSPVAWTASLRVQTPVYKIGAQGVTAPDLSLDATPGAPALPVWSTVVELPASGDYQISYQSPGAGLLTPQVAVAAAPAPDLPPPGPDGWMAAEELPAFVPTVDRPDPAIYAVDAFYPASPVVSGAEQWRQGRRLLALRVFPFQYNPVSRTLRYHPDLQITVRVTPAEQARAAIGRGDEGAAGNNAPASTAGALRIRTGERGLYRLTYADLLAAGVPLASVNPATFAMSYLGQPVAIQVTGDGDGQFEPGELVIFYAQPYEGRYQTDNVYWFTYGEGPGLRMAARAVTPNGSEPLVTTITRTVHIENDVVYQSTFPLPRDADHWFDTSLSPDAATGVLTATRSYDLALVDALDQGVVQIRAALHGGVNRPANPDKSIALYLNDHWVATHQWEGMTYTVADASAPAAWLDGAPNRVHLTAAISQLPGIDFYSVAPDWVQVTYPALASAQGDRVAIEGVAPGANQVAVSGWSTPAVQVYDLRQPNRPVRVLTTAAQPAGGGYTVSFWDAALPGPTYALSTEAALLAPLAIEPDTPSSWRTPGHEADYIAIVHPSLRSAIDPLLAHRAAEGLRVAKVDVQDIYDEWSYGRRDPEAIRSFLSYAFHHWNGAAEPPRYVLLVGDGHYDFTGASGTTLPNLIPPYLAHVDPWLGETAADNRFVSFDGPDDYLPEMAVGRIPARSAADVTAVVDKVIAYETAAAGGAWQERVVFVADNNLDPYGNFHALSDDVRLNWLPAAYDDRTIYYNRDYFTGAAMRTAIRAAFDDDALLLQWYGHGSKVRWGSVSMFNILDPAALAANDTWPFSASYSCWTGYFINLDAGYQSLGEVLVSTPQRGSVADLSPSGLHVGWAMLALNQGLTEAIFSQRIERVGDAVDAAKLHYFASSAMFLDVIDTSVLFGDPALRLRLPTASLETSTASVSPTQASPGDSLRYVVTVQNTGPSVLSEVTVNVDYDQARGQVTASSPPASDTGSVLTWTLATLAPGATVLTFDLLLDPVQPAGNSLLHAPTTVEAYGVPWVELDPTSQVSAAPDLSTSNLLSSRDWAPAAVSLTYTFTLSNSGNAPSAQTWLTATLPTDLVSVASSSLVVDPLLHRLTWQGPAPAQQTQTLTFTAAVAPERLACGQLELSAVVRDQLGQTTPLSWAVNAVVPDVDCDGAVDIVDVQLVAARWGAAQGDPAYHPRYDLNGDDQIDLLDVAIAAEAWHWMGRSYRLLSQP